MVVGCCQPQTGRVLSVFRVEGRNSDYVASGKLLAIPLEKYKEKKKKKCRRGGINTKRHVDGDDDDGQRVSGLDWRADFETSPSLRHSAVFCVAKLVIYGLRLAAASKDQSLLAPKRKNPHMMMDGPSKPPPLFDLSDWRLGEPPCSVNNIPSACICSWMLRAALRCSGEEDASRFEQFEGCVCVSVLEALMSRAYFFNVFFSFFFLIYFY